MADITKCSGFECPVKDQCYRYTAPASARQSYFWNTPGVVKNNEFTCDMYWGENAQSIWETLNDIVNNQTNQ
jgi:hypothetical protein